MSGRGPGDGLNGSIRRILPLLRPGGYFMLSHSENLNGVSDALKTVRPSIYRKPAA